MSEIEGYVVTVGVYVEKSFYIQDSDEESAVDIAVDEFKAEIEGLDYEEIDIEIATDPEYHEDE
jgi:uncharacterized protein (UPF0212 family)